jgi:hypothetical protein
MKYFEKHLTQGGKKISSKTNKFSLRKGPNSLGEKVSLSRNNVFSLRAMGFSSKNNHVSNRFVITTISCSFLYKFMTYD